MKYISRYFFSVRGYLWSLFKTFSTRAFSRKLFSSHYQYVHVVLPGPSAKSSLRNFLSNCPDLSRSCFLFVNHGIVLSSLVPNSVDKIFFTADSTRARQISLDHQNELRSCFSVFVPYHFFHLRNFNDYSNFDLYLTSKICWSNQYGVSTKSNNPSTFRALDKFPVSYGFGSLCYSMQLVALFNPESISIYGCDFGIPSSSESIDRYCSDNVPIRTDTPYALIRSHFSVIKEKFLQMNVKIELR